MYKDYRNREVWNPPFPATKQNYLREYEKAQAAEDTFLMIKIKNSAAKKGIYFDQKGAPIPR